MPFDGVMLSSVCHELHSVLENVRIDRIMQPERDEIHLILRSPGQTHRLLLSASAHNARAHLSTHASSNPPHPPMFCMLLRKQLSSGQLQGVRQMALDRVLALDFLCRNELGDQAMRTLVVEMMGKHSNIILLDENGVIVDAIKRIAENRSRFRQVLPGLPYASPPGGRTDPRTAAKEVFISIILKEGASLEKNLSAHLDGVSPGTARELLHRAGILSDMAPAQLEEAAAEKLAAECLLFFQKLNDADYAPCVRFDEAGMPVDVHPFAYLSTAMYKSKSFDSASLAVETYFYQRDSHARARQRTAQLRRQLQTRLERDEKKLASQLEDIKRAKGHTDLSLRGELLSSVLYKIKKGDTAARVADYTKEGMPEVDIPLDPMLSPSENVRKIFRQVAKAKATLSSLKEHIRQTEKDIRYVREQLYHLEQCGTQDEIDELRGELEEAGILRRKGKTRKSSGKSVSQPERFTSSAGMKILVGKNNTQNDRLIRQADGQDIWLHAKDRPGSHVIIKTEGKTPDDRTIEEAAMLAAYFSVSQDSANVPVDYLPRRSLKKPGGSAPGFVTFTGQQTAYVTPSEALVHKLKDRQDD
ncbi:MAG: Rqc2 family fibronectin-binding protein [Christensenellales bacterium]|jgi:predicted ribosome quality control (RQC) complex YloA/Tae2 family protein